VFESLRRGALREIGDEPDVRFTYANERTFLAWSRTALALVVTGIAATQLLPELDIGGERKIIGIPLIVLGAVIELVAYQHWFANERAMRLNEPLPQSRLVLVLAIGVAVVGAIATVVATTQ
jgi:putative membrane protein